MWVLSMILLYINLCNLFYLIFPQTTESRSRATLPHQTELQETVLLVWEPRLWEHPWPHLLSQAQFSRSVNLLFSLVVQFGLPVSWLFSVHVSGTHCPGVNCDTGHVMPHFNQWVVQLSHHICSVILHSSEQVCRG